MAQNDASAALIRYQEFMSFEEFDRAMDQWAVIDGFTFYCYKSDTTRKILRCRMQDNCPFRIRANWNDHRGCVQITSIHTEHICLGAMLPSRSVASRQRWLLEVVPNLLIIERSTKPAEIQNAIRIKYNTQISYQAAHKVKRALLDDTLELERELFTQLPAYFRVLQQHDPAVYTHLSLEPTTRQFQRLFICPSASKYTFTHCRPFIALDGTFLKTRFVQTLLLAVTIDANDQVLPLAYGVVESENTSSWEYFLAHLKSAIPRTQFCTLISDRDKGLMTAIPDTFPHAIQAYCCQHLAANVQKKYLLAARNQFWKIARAKTQQAFEDGMTEMHQIRPDAVEYLRNIASSLWAYPFVSGPRFGHDTSNIVESANNMFLSERELPLLKMLDAIWHKIMAMRFKRYQAAQDISPLQPLTPHGQKLLQHALYSARQHVPQMQSAIAGRVRETSGATFIVHLEQRTCSCKGFQDQDSPCSHAIAAIYAVNRAPINFMPIQLHRAIYIEMYQENLPPIDISNIHQSIEDNDGSSAPLTRIPKGRPRKQRLRVGETRVRNTTCSTCGEAGHNLRTCRRPHA